MPRESAATVKKILVANPFGLGDVLFSMTLVEALKENFPEARISFLCNERTIELVAMNSSIDRRFVFNRDRFRALWPVKPVVFFKEAKGLFSEIRHERFDALFDLSLGREFSFYAGCLGIPKRIGLDYKNRGLFLTHKTKIAGYEGLPVADLQLGLLRHLGLDVMKGRARLPIRVPEEAKEKAAALLQKSGIAASDKILAMAPGGGKSWGPNAVYKQWSPERFAQAAGRFTQTRPYKIVLLGDKSEALLLEQAAHSLNGRSLCLAGENFDVLCAVLLRSHLLLCNDGGLLHLANALGVKTVSIFGPVDEKVYGPYGVGAAHEVMVESVPCRPCYQKFHFPPCPHHRRCLDDLKVEKVLAALEKIA